MSQELPEDLRMFKGDRVAEVIDPVITEVAWASPEDLGVKRAAAVLSVHPHTLKKMLNLGYVVGAYRIGSRGDWRIPLEALEDFKIRGGSRSA